MIRFIGILNGIFYTIGAGIIIQMFTDAIYSNYKIILSYVQGFWNLFLNALNFISSFINYIQGFIFFGKIFLIDLVVILIVNYSLIQYLKFTQSPDSESNVKDEFEGIKCYRSQMDFLDNYLENKLENVKNNGTIDILGIDLWYFVNVSHFFVMINKAIDRGIKFRLFLLNPLSSIKEYVPMNREQSINNKKDYNSTDLGFFVKRLETDCISLLKDKYPEFFEIIIYNDIPEYLMINLNNESLIVCPFIRLGNAEGGPCIEFGKEDETMFNAYLKHFNEFIKSRKSISIEKFYKALENQEVEKGYVARRIN